MGNDDDLCGFPPPPQHSFTCFLDPQAQEAKATVVVVVVFHDNVDLREQVRGDFREEVDQALASVLV